MANLILSLKGLHCTDTILRSSSFVPDVSECRSSFGRPIQCRFHSENRLLHNPAPSLISGRKRDALRHGISELNKGRGLIAPRSIELATEPNSCNYEVFEGLDGSDSPVGVCEIRSLAPALSLEEAMLNLYSAITNLKAHSSKSGTFRFQVSIPPELKALQWLRSQPTNPTLLPRSYFSPREPRETGEETNDAAKKFCKLDFSGVGAVAGVGAAVLFTGEKTFSLKDWKIIKRFLSKQHPLIRAYGAMRFDPKMEPSEEWRPFGSFYFFIPQIEFCEFETCSLLAVTLVWDEALNWPLSNSLQNALTTMQMVSTEISTDNETPEAQVLGLEHTPNEQDWHDAVNKTVDRLTLNKKALEYANSTQQSSEHDPTTLFKVVMARRTKLEMTGQVDPMSLLISLQDADRSAYQFALQVPDGSAFIGCSPERLFVRDGLLVASEAVAGTRARGADAVKDQQLGEELLQSAKDHFEFEIVRQSIKHNMEAVCKHVVPGNPKSLLKQSRVQHLYARINGELHSDAGEFDMLSVLHPTPAVCGHPQKPARETISKSEAFDRGLYAGPVGWLGGDGAELSVGIRSCLIQPSASDKLEQNSVGVSNGSLKPKRDIDEEPSKGACISLYAGVGVVKSSSPASEWRELELKTSPIRRLLNFTQQPVGPTDMWAKHMVEEFCRLGVTYFLVSPGARSSPIWTVADANPSVTSIPCSDEGSTASLAVRYAKGANRPAVVVTTAVSDLLPIVFEVSRDSVPLVVIRVDGPVEKSEK